MRNRGWQYILLFLPAVFLGFLTASPVKAQQITASIRGTAVDPSGAVIPGVQLTATNVGTNINYAATSNADGIFEFLNLPIGTYKVSADKAGFKTFEASGITLVIGQAYVLKVQMQIGEVAQTVTVEAAPVQVETVSMQHSVTITGQQIEDAPLNGRNFVQLQQMAPGVEESSDRFGSNYSTNGSETQQNSYLINGVDSSDIALNTPLITPSPDALSEFTMVDSTSNPEYGRNSGAILNVGIKSGTNSFHGDAFDFFRDTSLNGRNFFQAKPSIFHRNQFGATIGGPIWKNHTFFFFSYQGSRFAQPQGFSLSTVPSTAEAGGDFSASSVPLASSANSSPIPLFGDSASPCPVAGGTRCAAGTPYASLFSTNVIPSQDINAISSKLVKSYVPAPNFTGSRFTFNPTSTGLSDQELLRIDHRFNANDSIWEYSLFERDPSSATLPFGGTSVNGAFGGTLPGFAQTQQEHIQQHSFAWDHTFSGNMLNELRGGYTRLNFNAVIPANPLLPSSLGFTGINPQNAAQASVPFIDVSGGDVNFALGFSEFGPQPRIDQTYQVGDSLSYVYGTHTLKFGYEGRRFEVANPFYAENNGAFTYAGTGAFSTGNPMADLLLGFPDSYTQSSGNVITARAYEDYSYAQDEWKMKSNLTMTYGFGWDIETPLTDFTNDKLSINCFIPGEQSKIFPSAPAGLAFPGDRGCNGAGYKTHYSDIAPRLGFAWAPNLGWLSGGASGKLSIRAGFAMAYNRSEEELTLQFLTDPPFAVTDFGMADVGGVPSFAAPFSDVRCVNGSGQAISSTLINCSTPGVGSIPNKYPFIPPKAGSSPNFGFFEPFGLATIDPNYRAPYAENYNLTIERQLPSQTILTVAYVGSEGHREEMWYERNPTLPGTCSNDPACAGNPFFTWEFPQYHKYDSTIFGSIGTMASMGNSNYNSLQVTLNKHESHGLYTLVSYTYAHALDWSSSFENEAFGPLGTDPFNFKRYYGNSAYDGRQRLVFNYGYTLPKIPGTANHAFVDRIVNGWHIAGITTLQSGLPVPTANQVFGYLGTSSDTCPGTPVLTVTVACWDAPNVTGPVATMNPRATSNNLYFDPTKFSNAVAPALGGGTPFNTQTGGNAGRQFIHGPGLDDWDFQLSKEFPIYEQTRIELRAEVFNIFNHANFANPDGNLADGPSFGTVGGINGLPRIVQLAAKVYF
jgi:hypothetical protein